MEIRRRPAHKRKIIQGTFSGTGGNGLFNGRTNRSSLCTGETFCPGAAMAPGVFLSEGG